MNRPESFYQGIAPRQRCVLPPSEDWLYKVRCRRCGLVTPQLEINPVPEWREWYWACRCPQCGWFIKRVRKNPLWLKLAMEQAEAIAAEHMMAEAMSLEGKCVYAR